MIDILPRVLMFRAPCGTSVCWNSKREHHGLSCLGTSSRPDLSPVWVHLPHLLGWRCLPVRSLPARQPAVRVQRKPPEYKHKTKEPSHRAVQGEDKLTATTLERGQQLLRSVHAPKPCSHFPDMCSWVSHVIVLSLAVNCPVRCCCSAECSLPSPTGW